MATDWFDRFASHQLNRLDARWDRAVARIQSAANPSIRAQVKAQGDIVIGSRVIGGVDEHASLERTVRGNAPGKRKPSLSQLDGTYE